jgi:uncharacterized glyoxalase superfamily protein PhnB
LSGLLRGTGASRPIEAAAPGTLVATAAQIKALFLEFKSAGADFFQTLQKAPWGARNFIVRDPDGNLILFAGPSD